MTFKEIFANYHTIAVYGMSKQPAKPAHSVPAYLLKQGYKIIPVNPTADFILDLQVYGNLHDIPDDIDILNVFKRSEDVLKIVEEAVERHNQRGDIKLIWLQEGIFSNEGKELAEANGIEFIQNRCMYKDFVNSDVR
jgi:predicted CoA-binding protein